MSCSPHHDCQKGDGPHLSQHGVEPPQPLGQDWLLCTHIFKQCPGIRKPMRKKESKDVEHGGKHTQQAAVLELGQVFF